MEAYPMDDKLMKNQWEIFSTIDEIAYNVDNKELTKAMAVFSEDARLEIYEGGKLTTVCENKQAIQNIITEKIENYDVVFHNNGTKKIDVQSLDQAATANTTCIAQLIKTNPASTTWQTMEYNDSFVKLNEDWYLVKRVINILSKSVRG